MREILMALIFLVFGYFITMIFGRMCSCDNKNGFSVGGNKFYLKHKETGKIWMVGDYDTIQDAEENFKKFLAPSEALLYETVEAIEGETLEYMNESYMGGNNQFGLTFNILQSSARNLDSVKMYYINIDESNEILKMVNDKRTRTKIIHLCNITDLQDKIRSTPDKRWNYFKFIYEFKTYYIWELIEDQREINNIEDFHRNLIQILKDKCR